MRYYSSIASTKTLSSAISAVATSMTLNNVTGLPAVPFTLVIEPDVENKEEIVLVTNVSGTTLTITRGINTYQGVAGGDGTSAVAHDAGVAVKHMITARDLQEPQTHMNSSQDVHGLTGTGTDGGDVVGTSKSQTLTNKTINSSNNSISISTANVSGLSTLLDAKANLASPTFTGTVVLPSSTSIGSVDSTELGYLNGVTSAIQTQLDAKQASDADLTAIAGLSTTGIVVRTGAGTAATRSLVAGTNITLTNADGVSGNITINATGGTSGVSSIAGTTNQITASASTGAVTLSLPSTLTLPSATVATTQTAGDNSTKVATTAYVKTAVDTATAAKYASLYVATSSSSSSSFTVGFNGETFDTENAHSNATNPERYTAGTTGKYLMNSMIRLTGGGTSTITYTISYRVNGTSVTGSSIQVPLNVSSIAYVPLSQILSLTAGQYADIHVSFTTISSGSNPTVDYGQWTVQYLGA